MKLVKFKHFKRRNPYRILANEGPVSVRWIASVHHFGAFVFKAELSWGDRKQEIILTM